MPPKKEAAPAPKPLLGRPSNNLKMGICGLPNVGKSLLFNTLTNSSVPSENYPFCTIDPSEARVAVPDENFDWLVANYKPASVIRAWLTCIDIAGLVKGASSGEGLGNAFLSHIRSVDALFHVVRAFDGTEENIVHVEGDVDPVRDLTIIREELRIKDVEWVQKVVDAGQKLARGGADKKKKEEWEIQCKVLNHLKEEKKDVRFGDWNAKEIEVINDLQLITAKSVVYLVNLSEEDYIRKKNKWLPKIKEWIDANTPGEPLIPFSGALENAAVSLSPEEKVEFFKNKNCVSALPKIVTTGYSTLQLFTFYTAGPTEIRAWTIRKGTKAPDAGGVIHSDFRDLFIQVEVMSFADLKEHGSEANVRAAGRYLQKGRDYEVAPGDILLFRFGRK